MPRNDAAPHFQVSMPSGGGEGRAQATQYAKYSSVVQCRMVYAIEMPVLVWGPKLNSMPSVMYIKVCRSAHSLDKAQDTVEMGCLAKNYDIADSCIQVGVITGDILFYIQDVLCIFHPQEPVKMFYFFLNCRVRRI